MSQSIAVLLARADHVDPNQLTMQDESLRARELAEQDELLEAARALESQLDVRGAAQLALAFGERLATRWNRPIEAADWLERAAAFERRAGSARGELIAHLRALQPLRRVLDDATVAVLLAALESQAARPAARAERDDVENEIARAWQSLGRFEFAEQRFHKLAEDPTTASIAFRVLAHENRLVALFELGRYDDALDTMCRADDLQAGIGTPNAASLHNRAQLLLRVGRFADSLDTFERAERCYADAGKPLNAIQMRMFEAGALAQQGLHLDALALLEDARVALGERYAQSNLAGDVALTTGRVYASLGRTDAALERFDAAKTIAFSKPNPRLLTDVMHARGEALQRAGRLAEARDAFETLLGRGASYANELLVAAAETGLGDVEMSARNYEAALACFERAREPLQRLGGPYHGACADLNLGRALAQLGRRDEAEAEVVRALDAFRRRGSRPALLAALAGAGRVHLLANDPRRALAELREAASVLEDALRSESEPLGANTSLETRDLEHDVLVDALESFARLHDVGAADIEALFAVVETYQGLSMAQQIAERDRWSRVSDAALTRAQSVLREAEGALAECVRAAHAADSEPRRAAERRVAVAHDELARCVEDSRLRDRATLALVAPRAATLAQVRELLPAGALLLEYAIAGDRGIAFAVTSDSTWSFDLGAPSELARLTGIVREELDRGAHDAGHGRAAYEAALRELGSRLLAPALERLPATVTARPVWIVPSGVLAQIPFEALLLSPPRASQAPSAWGYAVKSLDIAYIHSATTMRELSLGRRGGDGSELRVALIADPSYGSSTEPAHADAGTDVLVASRGAGFAPLPFARQEALDIADLFASDTERDELRALAAPSSASAHVATRPPQDAAPSSDGRSAVDAVAHRAGGGPRADTTPRDISHDTSIAAERELPTARGDFYTLYLGDRATERALLHDAEVARSRIVHVAAHGFADRLAPELSWLALAAPGGAQRERDDGFVFARELATARLRCELLVLSACDTHAGELTSLEGILGLSRAGLAAGARSVVSTLWEVEDAAASRLVVDFYRNLIEPDGTRAASLARAKRAAIASGMPASTWSAYVLWDAP